MSTTRFATCSLCEAMCGLEVEVEEGRITGIRGDARDPLSRGYLCPKGVALRDLHEDPDRIRTPLRRVGDRWHEIGWDEALDEAATRLADIQRAHGRDAVGAYIGNPSVHSHEGVLFAPLLLGAMRTRNLFTSNSADGLPRMLVSWLLYGSRAIIPIPDIDRTDFLLILGANPAVSNGSIMTAPDCKRRLRAISDRGGKVVVIDPRRTETAALADAHHFIQPGADALLLAAMIRTVLDDAPAPPPHLRELLDGWEDLPALVAPFSPERVAAAAGVSADEIRALARAFAGAGSAVCYGRLGTCTQEFGSLTTWLIDILNVVTGNLDRPGGAMFPTPAVDLVALAARLGQCGSFGRWRSRVRGLPEFSGELPVAALAEDIDTPGDNRIRGLVTYAGNPVLSTPNGRRLDRALTGLDFMVSIDIYRNETTRRADLILPTSTGLERDHYGLIFHALAVRNTAKYTPAAVEAPAGVRHDWEIFVELSSRLLARRSAPGRLAGGAIARLGRRIGPRGLLRAALRHGAYGRGLRPGGGGLSLAALEDSPHGVDLGPLVPRLREILATRPRRVRLAPPQLVADLTRLATRLDEPAVTGEEELLLIGRRHLRSNNSWMHNSRRLVKGKPRCTLLMHPDDAVRRGLSTGDRARIASRVGAIDVPVEVSEAIMPGVVSLPHGWGHDRDGAKLEVAAAHAGVSVNDVVDETLIDPVSGCSSLSGIPVQVTAAARRGALPTARAGEVADS